MPDPANPPATGEAKAGGELRHALNSPFQSADLPVALSILYSASPDPNKPRRTRTILQATMVIDAHGLKPDDIGEGKRRLVLDVLAGIWGEANRPIAIVGRRFTVEKAADVMQRELEKELAIEIDVPVPEAGDYQLRSAVRDAASGKTGSDHC